MSRKVNQSIQRILYEKNYDKLIETTEEFIKTYPLCNVAQKAVTVVSKIKPYCDGELLYFMVMRCEDLQVMTPNYHAIILRLPYVKLYIKLHKQITASLLVGSADIELTYHYLKSEELHEEFELLNANYYFKLQEVAPHIVHQYT